MTDIVASLMQSSVDQIQNVLIYFSPPQQLIASLIIVCDIYPYLLLQTLMLFFSVCDDKKYLGDLTLKCFILEWRADLFFLEWILLAKCSLVIGF